MWEEKKTSSWRGIELMFGPEEGRRTEERELKECCLMAVMHEFGMGAVGFRCNTEFSPINPGRWPRLEGRRAEGAEEGCKPGKLRLLVERLVSVMN